MQICNIYYHHLFLFPLMIFVRIDTACHSRRDHGDITIWVAIWYARQTSHVARPGNHGRYSSHGRAATGGKASRASSHTKIGGQLLFYTWSWISVMGALRASDTFFLMLVLFCFYQKRPSLANTSCRLLFIDIDWEIIFLVAKKEIKLGYLYVACIWVVNVCSGTGIDCVVKLG